MKEKNNESGEKLKRKEKEIIDMLIRFRYLDRMQLQTLLHHKFTSRIIIWLNVLVEKEYIYRFYSKKLEKSPATYCLSRRSIPYLRTREIQEKMLKRVYSEKTNSPTFRERCKFVATIYVSLLHFTKQIHGILSFKTKIELEDIQYLIFPHPDCYFAITSKSGNIKRYMLDVFDNENFLFKRVHQHVKYYKRRYWQNHTTKPFPEIIFVCPTVRAKTRIHTFIQKRLTPEFPSFYLTTWQAVREKGIKKEILEKVHQ